MITDVAFSWSRLRHLAGLHASLLTDELRGKRADEITDTRQTPYVTELLGIEVGPARIHCALLGLETTQKAIASLSSKQVVTLRLGYEWQP